MSISVKEYAELREKAESLKREAERAAGARGELLRQLKSKFGVTSVADAERLLAKKRKLLDRAEAELKLLVNNFNAEYGDALGRIGEEG